MVLVTPYSLPELALLSGKDVPAVAALYTRCADYFLLQDGEVPGASDAEELFLNVPPGKSPEDLTVFGIMGTQRLDAVAAMLPGYPEDGIWYLPFIVIAPDRRGQGLGRGFYTALEQWAGSRGAREIRLCVLEDNHGGERFWRSLGFEEICRVGPHAFKSKSHRRIEFKRAAGK
jgi:ribosomal protein S18 acetylase RimI-like enzyme